MAQNPTPNTVYSESPSYEPRKFDDKKKQKQPKKKSDLDNQPLIADSELKIPVFVYDPDEKPVTDLTAADFKLLIGDKEQEIAAFEIARAPLDIVLVVDTSPSTTTSINDLKGFVTKIVEALKPEDKIQIITFNSRVKILFEPTNDKQIIGKAVKKIETGDGTSIYEAVDTIFRKYLSAADAQKTVILLSDGVDTTSQNADFAKSLRAAENNFSAVFPFYLYTFEAIPKYPTVPVKLFPGASSSSGSFKIARAGVTKEDYELGLNYLQDIAALSGGRAFQIKTLTEVKPEELGGILEFLKPQYYISFKLPASAEDAARRPIKLRINRPNLKIQSRGSYLAR
ncbi:MAG TPA: VWA domain-containing protein [Pyrinomonadaceae bacterium]